MRMTILIGVDEGHTAPHLGNVIVDPNIISDVLLKTKIPNIVENTVYELLAHGVDITYVLDELTVDAIDTLIYKYNHLVDIDLYFIDPQTKSSDADRYVTLKKAMIGKRSYYPQVSYVVTQRDHLPGAYIVDIDGTVALRTDRDPYDLSRAGTDSVFEDVAEVIRKLSQDNYIIYLSGRDESSREITEHWLRDNELWFNHSRLYMRTEKDQRRDSIVKEELFNYNLRDKFYIKGVFDDRLQVQRECWNKLGLTVFNVNQNLKNF